MRRLPRLTKRQRRFMLGNRSEICAAAGQLVRLGFGVIGPVPSSYPRMSGFVLSPRGRAWLEQRHG